MGNYEQLMELFIVYEYDSWLMKLIVINSGQNNKIALGNYNCYIYNVPMKWNYKFFV